MTPPCMFTPPNREVYHTDFERDFISARSLIADEDNFIKNIQIGELMKRDDIRPSLMQQRE